MQISAYAAKSEGAALEPWDYEIDGPGDHGVLIKVINCGLCHSDLHFIDNDFGATKYPMVPGHEVVGEVLETGRLVEHLKSGDRVGVGWQRGSCMHCEDCLRGDEILCDENTTTIGDGYGGFCEHLLHDARFTYKLPDGVASENGGPLLCGGVTVYGALVAAGMKPGDHVGVIGIGGLGHMAIQFASKLGARVTALTTSPDKAEEAAKLGAHEAITGKGGDFDKQPKRPFDLLVSTAPVMFDYMPYIDMLGSDGTLCFVGLTSDPLTVPIFPLLVKRRRVMANPLGGRHVHRDMLRIADEFGIEPVTETFPMSKVNDAIQKVRENTIRYRAVLEV